MNADRSKMSTVYSHLIQEHDDGHNITIRKGPGFKRPNMAAPSRYLDHNDSLFIDSILSQDETEDVVTMLTMADELEGGSQLPSFYTSSQMGGKNQQRRPSSPPLSPILSFRSTTTGRIPTCYEKGDNEQQQESINELTSQVHSMIELDLNRRNISGIGEDLIEGRRGPGSVPDSMNDDALNPDVTIFNVGKGSAGKEGVTKGDVSIGDATTITTTITPTLSGQGGESTRSERGGEVETESTHERADGKVDGEGDDSSTGSSPDKVSDDDQGKGNGGLPNHSCSSPQEIAEKFRSVDAILLSMEGKSSTLSTTVRSLESSLEFSQNEILQLKKENADLMQKLGSLETEDRRTRFQVNTVEDKLDRLETSTKKKNLIFEGVPEIEGRREDVDNSVGKLFDQLAITDRVNFEACYRVGTYRAGRVRPILVAFERQMDRDLIYSKRFDLKRTKDFQKVWINEDLGPASKKKREMIRLIAREAKLQGVDCRTGKYALHIDGTKFDHNNLEDLPPQLQPTSLKQVRIDKNTIAYQSEHAPFSNFFSCDIIIGIHTFFCVEQAFQFMKAKTLKKALVATKIFLCRDVRLIKQWGDELGTSPEWEARQFEVMYGCLKKKFNQSQPLKDLLLSTGKMMLVEATPNRLWGCGATLSSNALRKREWPGQNKHGEILMTVRDELRLACKN